MDLHGEDRTGEAEFEASPSNRKSSAKAAEVQTSKRKITRIDPVYVPGKPR